MVGCGFIAPAGCGFIAPSEWVRVVPGRRAEAAPYSAPYTAPYTAPYGLRIHCWVHVLPIPEYSRPKLRTIAGS